MSSEQHLNELLHDAKRRSGLSVRALAKKGGLSHGTVENVLKNAPRTHPIPEPTIDKLAKAFDVPAPRLRAAHYADLGIATVTGTTHTTGTAFGSATQPPVGLGLDDAATDLRPEQVEAIRALIRSMKAPPETP